MLSLIICTGFTSVLVAQPRIGGLLNTGVQAHGTLIHFMLLDQPSVQDELRVTPDQAQKARQVADAQRRKLEGLNGLPREEAAKKVAEAQQSADKDLQAILTTDQFRRLREIGLQQLGPISMGRADVAEAVGLTPEQQQQVRTMQDRLMQTAAQGFQGGRPGPGAGPRGGLLDTIARIQTAKRETDQKILALLTAEQKSKWTQLQGAPFQGQLNMGPLGGRILGQ